VKSKLLTDENGLKTFALVFDKDDEVKESLMRFAAENRLHGAEVTAIGAFSEVTLGYFDREKKSYREIPMKEREHRGKRWRADASCARGGRQD